MMPWLHRVWQLISEPFRFLKPIRFIAIPLALLLWALIWADQGQDAIRALIEVDPRCPEWLRKVLFCVTVAATALQSWYWSRQLLRIDFPRCGHETPAAGGTPAAPAHPGGDDAALAGRLERLERWAPRLLGVAVYLIAIAAVGKAAYNSYSGEWDYASTVAAITAGMLLVLLFAFVAFVLMRRRFMTVPSHRVASPQGLGTATRRILYASVAVALGFVIWTALSPLTTGIVFPSPSLLMISAALWAGIGSCLVFWFDLYRVPLVSTMLVLAIVFSPFNDNHAVRTLTTAQGGGDPAARLSLDATFDAWYAKLAAKYPQEPAPPVFVVATEGGGIRAAYWTAAVLTAIQDQAPEFSDHLFAISGVSGGSLGATVFTALVGDRNRAEAVDSCAGPDPAGAGRTLRFAAQQMLSYDFLAPTLGSMLHADLVQRFLPVGFIPDRAKALETGWERAYRTHVRTAADGDDDFFASGLLEMYAGAGDALLPSLFLNGTTVEVGNRLIASNCDLRDGAIPDATDLLDRLGRDLRLSTAAHNSARFTYVSPAGSVHADGGELVSHVVDGGYFENSGAQTAADIIARLAARRGERPFTIHLILIKYQEIAAAECRTLPPAPVPPEKFMNEALSPLRAILDTRGAHGTVAYQEALELPAVEKYQFLLTQRQHGIVMPLGWLLAPRTRHAIDLQVGPKTPDEIDCAIKPYVEKNVQNLRAIAELVGRQPVAAELDAVQQDAQEGELAATDEN